MKCKWCDCDTDGTNHQTTAACVEALKRELQLLRAQARLRPARVAPEDRGAGDGPDRPWKMRTP